MGTFGWSFLVAIKDSLYNFQLLAIIVLAFLESRIDQVLLFWDEAIDCGVERGMEAVGSWLFFVHVDLDKIIYIKEI